MAASNAPAYIESLIPGAQMAGQGSYRWFGMKIYDAQLWVGEKGYTAGALASARFALNLRYARELQGSKIASASLDEIKKLGMGSADQHKLWLNRMEQLFPDVKEGSQITGIHLPNQGARFYLDERFIGEVQDPEFGTAFFSIWLDPNTSAKSLRQALIVNSAPR